MLDVTPRANVDYMQISNAISMYDDFNIQIKKSGFSSENLVKLQEIEQKIQGLEGLSIVEPHRVLVKEGPIQIVFDKHKRDEYYTFLFTDMVLLTKKQSNSSILAKKRGTGVGYQYIDHGYLYRASVEPDGMLFNRSTISYLI